MVLPLGCGDFGMDATGVTSGGAPFAGTAPFITGIPEQRGQFTFAGSRARMRRGPEK